MATRHVRPVLRVIPLAVLITVLSLSGVGIARTSSPSTVEGTSCSVTFQSEVLDTPQMGWGSAEMAYGTDTLGVTLPSGGSLESNNLDDQGRIWDKFLYWGSSGDEGIEITGHRLDADAPPLISEGIEPDISGGLATMITFPTTGCWEVTADRGDIQLTFVMLVARAWEYPEGVATPLTNDGPPNG